MEVLTSLKHQINCFRNSVATSLPLVFTDILSSLISLSMSCNLKAIIILNYKQFGRTNIEDSKYLNIYNILYNVQQISESSHFKCWEGSRKSKQKHHLALFQIISKSSKLITANINHKYK